MRKQREVKVKIIMDCTPEELSTRYTLAMLKILDERKAQGQSIERLMELTRKGNT